jgi:shikimate kinase
MTGLSRTVALVGMMGAGKSSVGRRLAARLGVAFKDADSEIELAAGCPIPELFARFGEGAFRDGERKVIARLLEEPPLVLATGGGAFADAATRARLKEGAVTVWIKVPIDVLFHRVKRRDNRPLLRTEDPRGMLERLLVERMPAYAQADVIIESSDGPHTAVVEQIVAALQERGVTA